ncbi:hypothetical protein ACIF8T_19510 [Streptomyces sp. NPDC085946]|uniref:hypothetical protein n=1 Tax=Streptomyces sp. NPDC085946 TaxID=3365744 RepID=UPI0037D4B03B
MFPDAHRDPLLPAALRELPPPWNDLTRRRTERLEDLPRTEANERSALDALAAALSGPPPRPGGGAWSDESEELHDRFRREAAPRLAEAVPTTARLTREAVEGVLTEWARTARPPVPQWWPREHADRVAAEWAAQALADWAHDVLRWLERAPHDEEAVAAVAERCAEHGLSSPSALGLLHALGAPRGEAALLRLVRSPAVREDDRQRARDHLLDLRRPRYRARAQEPADGEEPLLPPPARDLPYAWSAGFQWPQELPETQENFARARAVLEACAPAGPVAEPVPAPSWQGSGDEEPPVWLDVRRVMRDLMPCARLVTRERLTEAMRECALLGVPGVPRDPDGEAAERFIGTWVTWIGGWIAGEVFTWLGMYVDDGTALTPWAMDLAERYARNGVAAEQAVSMLRWWHTDPRSREALTRLAADDSLPDDLRELARGGLGQ